MSVETKTLKKILINPFFEESHHRKHDFIKYLAFFLSTGKMNSVKYELK